MNDHDIRMSANIIYNRTLLEYAFSMIARMSDKPHDTVRLMHDVMARAVAKRGAAAPGDAEVQKVVKVMAEMNDDFFKEVEGRVRSSPR